ncbi:radical SAM protein [Thermodesulfobacteriota bacterium]
MQASGLSHTPGPSEESPEFVRLSLAAAMTLGFVRGWFYRNARLGCINLLLTYDGGCAANCAFCGLGREKDEAWAEKKFIRVPWIARPTEEVIEAVKSAPPHVGRVCISMITNPRCRDDVLTVCRGVAKETGLGISLLIAPTLLRDEHLVAMKDAGADRIGVAIDAATPEIFDRFRGRPVKGPHKWDNYWRIYERSLEVFGEGMSGVHLICGLGETEKELTQTIDRAHGMGGGTHLFSFFPERGSLMEDHVPPPMGQYRRIQLARWLIDNDRTQAASMEFDSAGRIRDFGIPSDDLSVVIALGEPFETSGCPGPDGKVACNRPYGNERPGRGIRNFPFSPNSEDLERVRNELNSYDD